MNNEKLINIDDYMNASDIIELLEENKERAEVRYNSYVRSDGIPKKGKALFANAADNMIMSINNVIRLIEKEMEEHLSE